MGPLAFSSVSLVFLETLAAEQRAEGEGGDSIYSLLFCGLVIVGWQRPGAVRRASPYSYSFRFQVTVSSICPFRPHGLCCSSSLRALGHIAVSCLLKAFVNRPCVRSPHIVSFKLSIWVSSRILMGAPLIARLIPPHVFAPLFFHYHFL